ncbi:unnamed protein product [Medioppia subpectinata]|uniref:Sex-determining region Y protein n=1 Tax=Medioppia subpectinata TaxID=1979941 RepID=A0A7R9KYS3_9ACAR|nr:unnamed protein product [Medioppia subpectinata]CAG2112141.1 unnamed protein product [Medioppia subpectinata]
MEKTIKKKSQSRVRRPLNPFFLFSNENRKRLSLENPTLGNREVSRLLGTLWAQLEAKQKEEYIERAAVIYRQHLKDNPGYKFDPWVNKRVAVKRVAVNRKPKNFKIKSASNVIILRAVECPTLTPILSDASDDWCEIPAPTTHVEPITEEKLIFTKLLGLCRKNSKEYFDLQTKLALKSLNQQMSHWFLTPSLPIRRRYWKSSCGVNAVKKPLPIRRRYWKSSCGVNAVKKPFTGSVKRGRGRPKKRVKQVVTKSNDHFDNSSGHSNGFS